MLHMLKKNYLKYKTTAMRNVTGFIKQGPKMSPYIMITPSGRTD